MPLLPPSFKVIGSSEPWLRQECSNRPHDQDRHSASEIENRGKAGEIKNRVPIAGHGWSQAVTGSILAGPAELGPGQFLQVIVYKVIFNYY